jgi:hypothetical protein
MRIYVDMAYGFLGWLLAGVVCMGEALPVEWLTWFAIYLEWMGPIS